MRALLYLALTALASTLVATTLTGCMVGDDPDDIGDEDLVDTSAAISAFATKPGVNSGECTASPFNCRFRAGDSRVTNAAGGESWAIAPGASVRDGDGNVLAVETGATL